MRGSEVEIGWLIVSLIEYNYSKCIWSQVIVPFQYAWLDEMFRELATLVFFVMTGYKFRPAAANPYFTPNHEDDESHV